MDFFYYIRSTVTERIGKNRYYDTMHNLEAWPLVAPPLKQSPSCALKFDSAKLNTPVCRDGCRIE
ncbi:hypothetical protein NECAME_03763 [Necator americanus]|uniref:Uncharacterized protein n=1 Tax=Necator americanus TaxID=51031 RepID=W2T2D8_NECAM|nr:hypothetical protein NECAME_03763 [Necator americanus]ETN75381.1 hypothetical protein NECAME_03763 [Necator americanus]